MFGVNRVRGFYLYYTFVQLHSFPISISNIRQTRTNNIKSRDESSVKSSKMLQMWKRKLRVQTLH